MGFLSSVEETIANSEAQSAVPGEQEYKLRIVDVKSSDEYEDGLPRDKNGNAYLMPRFEIPEEPLAKDFGRYMAIPNASMDDKRRNSSAYAIRQFLEAFNLDAASLDTPSDMIGSEGWAILGLEDNEQYGEQNYVKKFVIPA